MRLGDLDALKKTFEELHLHPDLIELIDNAPSVNPCNNCDLYFKAMTKEVTKNDVSKRLQ